MTAYGVDIQTKDPNSFKSPLAFDAHDNWLGNDFDYFLDNMLDDLFADIEEDLLSVWSTNKSEQESAQYSAQRSADASAMGMTDDGAATGDDDSGFTVETTESAGSSSVSSTEMSVASLDHDLSDHSGFKHKGHFHHPLESRYSGTNSENLDGDTQGSHSHGTSDTQNDGKASTVSTQSIVLEEYKEIYENANDNEMITIMDAVDPSKVARGNRTTAAPGGIMWEGDLDAEFIWGTSWADNLAGGAGDDSLYGFEGNDTIEGGYGTDKVFGDAGDDTLYADTEANVGGSAGLDVTNLLSGGQGNDRMYGSTGPDVLFGGPGHDFLYGGYGIKDDVDARELHGGDGADEIWASFYGENEITGGAGDDMILGGVNTAGGLTQETFINLPRRATLPSLTTKNYRETYGSYGNLDIDGGDGDDFIIGGFGANDIQGGKGDDVIYGSQPNRGDVTVDNSYYADNEINGGEGDDLMFGVSISESMVLRGGDGNDTIYAGGFSTGDGSDYVSNHSVDFEDAANGYIYLYGDDGHDELVGADEVPFQYLFGGEGDDLIRGGYQQTSDGGSEGLFYADGGAGDDIIQPYQYYEDVDIDILIRGGKGNDKINVYEGSDLYDTDGSIDASVYERRVADDSYGKLTFDGGEGDDEIWMMQDWSNSDGDHPRLYGGNGDDILKSAIDTEYGMLIAGQGDEDLIDTQWLDSTFYGDLTEGGPWDLTIFGDWGYGPEDNRYGIDDDDYGELDASLMYGDPRLEEMLVGDDDVILIGYGNTSIENDVNVYAGDGDDLVDIHGNWWKYNINGGRGDDTFIVDGGWQGSSDDGDDIMTIKGGLGNDTFRQGAESAVAETAGTKSLSYGTQLYGGEGDDKFEQFISVSGSNELYIEGGAGSDKVSGGAGFYDVEVDVGYGDDIVYGFDDVYGQEISLSYGNDVFFGGNGGKDLTVYGGYGNDKIFGPNDNAAQKGKVTLYGEGDDDIIDFGDHNYGHYGYGGDGNDKIIGGIASSAQKLYGDDGDDKIWMINPEQRGQEGTISNPYGYQGYGGKGNDHIYGSDIGEYLVGDAGTVLKGVFQYGTFADYYNESGEGDDVIFGYGGDDLIFGMAGDDVLDGGLGDDNIVGGRGNDKLFGQEGDDMMFGDEQTTDSHDQSNDEGTDDDLALFGDDKMYGGAGADTMYASFGDDFMKGGADDDTMWGGAGEDTIYGEAGDDNINAGYGWDTIFGGDGCDTIEVIDGGDVVWLGDCDGTTGTMKNTLNIEGTGDDPENFVVVMDFWLESAKPFNEICLHVSENQENPSAPRCRAETSGYNNAYQREDNDGICVDATEIADPEQLYNEVDDRALGEGEWRGSGCKHDGGPLWISIPIVDDPVVAQETKQRQSNYYWNSNTSGYFENDGGSTYAMTIWARFFQRAHKQPVINRKKPRITSYNTPERYEYSSRYESQGRDLAGGSSDESNRGQYYGYGNGNGGNGYGYRPPQNDESGYFPRISHRGHWSQTESVSHHDEELIECLRIWLCDTETTQYTCYGGAGTDGNYGDCGSYTDGVTTV